MEKIRISSLAKDLGVKSGLLIDKCHECGLTQIHHHANTLLPEQAEMIKKLFQPETKVIAPKEIPKLEEVVTAATHTVEQKRETKVTTTERKRLLAKFVATFRFENNLSNCTNVNSSGKNLGGYTFA